MFDSIEFNDFRSRVASGRSSSAVASDGQIYLSEGGKMK